MHSIKKPEIVIGLVGPVGTNLKEIIDRLKERFSHFKYDTEIIKISDSIPRYSSATYEEIKSYEKDNYTRIDKLMTYGNEARRKSKNNSVLALAASANISKQRTKESPLFNKVFILDSLKHPDEVKSLRHIYGEGFYLIGVFTGEDRRKTHLTSRLDISMENAIKLMKRDEYEDLKNEDNNQKYGQNTRGAFELSDFFVYNDGNGDPLTNNIYRILDLIFGKPCQTPSFDEYAMFMASSGALRSADPSRQIGAVITKDKEILGIGANDCPKYGGGLYWPYFDESKSAFVDIEDGRDYTRGYDPNKAEQEKIIDDVTDKILKKFKDKDINEDNLRAILKESKIKDLTEFGRVVHAEMEALLSCARSNISTKDATMYCTTFPCHNCAKHIIAAGIKKVYYIEPYPKSKAEEFHSDSINIGYPEVEGKVNFIPFMGVGPRKFFDLFSMKSLYGKDFKRKSSDDTIIDWEKETAKPRLALDPASYIERERVMIDQILIEIKQEG